MNRSLTLVPANSRAQPRRGEDAAERRFVALAQSFPILRDRSGIDPWNPTFVDDWAASPGPGSGERWVLRFLLNLWDPYTDWPSGRFDVFEALAAWDEAHRDAFLSWARDPWWP